MVQIKSWLETADRHWHQAKAHRVFGRLDSAYVDYLLAFTIVIDIIPRCAEWPTFTRGKQSQNYEQLKKVRMAALHVLISWVDR